MQHSAVRSAAVPDRLRRPAPAGLALAWLGLGCLLVGCQGAPRPAGNGDWTVEGIRRTAPLAPGMIVDVANDFGDLRIRPADSGQLELSAQSQRWSSDPPAEVRLERLGERLAIAIVEPRQRETAGPRRRVDVAVLVPPGFPVHARTRDGVLDAKELAGPLDLHAEGGNVTVTLPFGAGATARLRTAGRISAIGHVEAVQEGHRRQATVVVGTGGPALVLESATGDVKVTAPGAEPKLLEP